MNNEIRNILIEEVQNKKEFMAQYQGRCDLCNGTILVNDSFVFMGDKRKVCSSCQTKIIEELENI